MNCMTALARDAWAWVPRLKRSGRVVIRQSIDEGVEPRNAMSPLGMIVAVGPFSGCSDHLSCTLRISDRSKGCALKGLGHGIAGGAERWSRSESSMCRTSIDLQRAERRAEDESRICVGREDGAGREDEGLHAG